MEPADARYELIERIGAGGMAEVYRAQMLGAAGFKKVVAVKRILPDLCKDKNFVDRFIDEARLTARLLHPNVCQVYDFGVLRGSYFIAMEFVEGLDLHRVLSYLDRRGERLPVDTALRITAEVLRGLGFAHRATDEQGRPLNIVHRDVSPHNVLLAATGGVKVGDFGCATAIAEMRLARTQANTTYGKLIYMSPEQIAGLSPDQRADVFSVGVVLSEMLQGTRGFRRSVEECIAERQRLVQPSVSELQPRLQAGLARILENALHHEADQRYPDAAAMVDDIERCLAALPHGSTADQVSSLVERFRNERSAAHRTPSRPGRQQAQPSSPWSAAMSSGEPAGPEGGTSQLGPEDLILDGDGTSQLGSAEIMLVDEGEADRPAAGPRVVLGGGAPESSDDLTTNVRGGGSPAWDEMAYEPTAHLDTGPRALHPGASDLLRGEAATRALPKGGSDPDAAATRAFPGGGAPVGPPGPNAPPSPAGQEDARTQAYDSGASQLDEARTQAYQSGPDALEELQTRAYESGPRSDDDASHADPAGRRGSVPGPSPSVGPERPTRRTADPVPYGDRADPTPSSSGEESLPYSVRMAKHRYGTVPRKVERVSYRDRPDRADRGEGPHAAERRYDQTEVVRTEGRRRSFRSALIGMALLTVVAVLMAAVVFVFEVDLRERAAALIGFGPASEQGPPLLPDAGTAALPVVVRDGGPDTGDAAAQAAEGEPRAPRRGPVRPPPRGSADTSSATGEEESPAPEPTGEPGRITVTSSSPGRVYVGGRLVAVQTPARGVEIPPGVHDVQVIFSDGSGQARRRVTVVAGQHHLVSFGD